MSSGLGDDVDVGLVDSRFGVNNVGAQVDLRASRAHWKRDPRDDGGRRIGSLGSTSHGNGAECGRGDRAANQEPVGERARAGRVGEHRCHADSSGK